MLVGAAGEAEKPAQTLLLMATVKTFLRPDVRLRQYSSPCPRRKERAYWRRGAGGTCEAEALESGIRSQGTTKHREHERRQESRGGKGDTALQVIKEEQEKNTASLLLFSY